MSNEKSRDNESKSDSSSTGGLKQSGDPGRTPGTAEGDEETVEESLREKETQKKS
ncbi:MAG: hypothetical protein H0V27_14800 [Pyrinomonadaceae bacterium]|jgi:hypothetical protein|nr:hypothetical protein [Pyrinomonadaceae bacterium]